MAQLYSNELVSLEKRIEVLEITSRNCKEFDLDFLYDLQSCKRWINEHGLKKVCLQFPDYLLNDATSVAKLFEDALGQHIYILGDTSYESCCVDYVAAAHIESDGIIHFGYSCFSKQTEKIPTLIVHEKTKFDLDKLFNAFVYQFQKRDDVAIVLDTPYAYKNHQIVIVKEINPKIRVHNIDEENLNVENQCVLYLGDNNRKLMLFNLLFKPKELYYYNNLNPEYVQPYVMDLKSVKRRSYLLEVIKDSTTVGVIIGTVAVKNYKVIIRRVMKLCKIHNKKYYLISVGKSTVAKLANYPELDVYVLISCAMNEIFESREFYKPIATPYDVEIALNPNANNVQYHNLTNLADNNEDLDNVAVDACDVSLISGKIRSIDEEFATIQSEDRDVALKSDDRLALQDNHGIGFLNSRTWKGLEQNLGETSVELATDGRKGIAKSYESEPKS